MMQKLRVLDLFSGIGGFSLGLERTGGFETVAFCEIEPYCRAVLAKHWPSVRQYDDVRALTADILRRDGIGVDVICGGFPCQDISVAGKGAGLAGARSGLWREYARIIGELRPSFVIVENVAALLGRGLADVLGDLASLGYDAEWHCIPAAAVGAPHRRDRLWVVANTARLQPGRTQQRSERQRIGASRQPQLMADANKLPWYQGRSRDAAQISGRRDADRGCEQPDVCNTIVSRLALPERQSRDNGQKLTTIERTDWWFSEPDVGRVAHGVRHRVDRLKGLGNAVVPQIPELIGKAILDSIQATT